MFTAVSDRSQVAEARRRISDEAAKIGVPQDRIGQTDMWVVAAMWDLSEVERMALQARL